MKTTIDRAGRVVIPQALRQQVGLGPGEVEIVADGDGVRIAPASGLTFEELTMIDGVPTLPRTGVRTTVDDLRELRLADQR